MLGGGEKAYQALRKEKDDQALSLTLPNPMLLLSCVALKLSFQWTVDIAAGRWFVHFRLACRRRFFPKI